MAIGLKTKGVGMSRVEQEAHDRDVVVSYQSKGWCDKLQSVIQSVFGHRTSGA